MQICLFLLEMLRFEHNWVSRNDSPVNLASLYLSPWRKWTCSSNLMTSLVMPWLFRKNHYGQDSHVKCAGHRPGNCLPIRLGTETGLNLNTILGLRNLRANWWWQFPSWGPWKAMLEGCFCSVVGPILSFFSTLMQPFQWAVCCILQ